MVIAVLAVIAATLLFVTGYLLGRWPASSHGPSSQAKDSEESEITESNGSLASGNGTGSPTSTEEQTEGSISSPRSGSAKLKQGSAPELPEQSDAESGKGSSDKSRLPQGSSSSSERVNKQTDNENAHANGLGKNAKGQHLNRPDPKRGYGPASASAANLDFSVDGNEKRNDSKIRPSIVHGSPDFADKIDIMLPYGLATDEETSIIGNTDGMNNLKISGYPVHIEREQANKGAWSIFPEDRNKGGNQDVDDVPQILIDDQSRLVFRYGTSASSNQCVRSLHKQGVLIIQWGDEGNEKTHVVRFNEEEADLVCFKFKGIDHEPRSIPRELNPEHLPYPDAVDAIKITNMEIDDPSDTFVSPHKVQPATSYTIPAQSSEAFQIKVECKKEKNANVWNVEAACYWEGKQIDSGQREILVKQAIEAKKARDECDRRIQEIVSRDGQPPQALRRVRSQATANWNRFGPPAVFHRWCKNTGVELKVSLAYDVKGTIVPVQFREGSQ